MNTFIYLNKRGLFSKPCACAVGEGRKLGWAPGVGHLWPGGQLIPDLGGLYGERALERQSQLLVVGRLVGSRVES